MDVGEEGGEGSWRGQVIVKCAYITSWLSIPNAHTHTHNEREREIWKS